MARQNKKTMVWRKPARAIAKCPTGIPGLDEITRGGLPRGRPTLVAGGPGSGKSVLAMDFIMRGILEHREPGVFVSFDERPLDVARNAASLGFDLKQLEGRKKLVVDHISMNKPELKTGDYDLEGLFIRLERSIRAVNAKRVSLDSLDALFSGPFDDSVLRPELRRLFDWLKAKGVTALITSERGKGELTRHGLEEYLSDCVILLDQRVEQDISTRRLRIVKYRGAGFGTNEYPFLIDEQGVTVMPITSRALRHGVSKERVSTGIARMDAMLGGGYWRASAILMSGTAGTGKTTLASHFADAMCNRGERCLYFSFDEAPDQIRRDLLSVGINFEKWEKRGLLRIESLRATTQGLEEHLHLITQKVRSFKPAAVIVDPITGLLPLAPMYASHSMLTRLIDFLKGEMITTFFTSLTEGQGAPERSGLGVSTLIDTWLVVRDIESNGEKNRGMFIVKSRGTNHSHQVREFLLTDRGVQLVDVYVGPAGLLVGAAGMSQLAQEKAENMEKHQDIVRKRHALEAKRKAFEKQMDATRASYDAEENEALRSFSEMEKRRKTLISDRTSVAAYRKADLPRRTL